MDQCYKSLGHKSAVLWMLFHPFCRNEWKIAIKISDNYCEWPEYARILHLLFHIIYVYLIQVLRGLIQPFDIPMKSWHWINTNDPLRDPRPLPEFARNPSCFMFTKSCRANSHWKPAHVDTPITRGEVFLLSSWSYAKRCQLEVKVSLQRWCLEVQNYWHMTC